MTRVRAAAVLGAALLAVGGCGHEVTPMAGDVEPPTAISATPPPSSPEPTESPSERAMPVRPCTANELTIQAAPREPFGSTRRSVLTATNTSAAPCTLSGVGSILLLAASGKTLSSLAGSAVRTGGGGGVTVAPAAEAYQDVSWRVVPSGPNGSPAECLKGPALLVTPPDAIVGALVMLDVTACDSGQLEAEPWSSRPPER